MRAYARMRGGGKRQSFGLEMVTVKELQIHYTYRKLELRFGDGVD